MCWVDLDLITSKLNMLCYYIKPVFILHSFKTLSRDNIVEKYINFISIDLLTPNPATNMRRESTLSQNCIVGGFFWSFSTNNPLR